MNDYSIRLKFTQIVLPLSLKFNSKDFPKAKVRLSTPKCQLVGDQKIISRPVTPKQLPLPPSPFVNNRHTKGKNSLQFRLLERANRHLYSTLNPHKRRKSTLDHTPLKPLSPLENSKSPNQFNFNIKSPTRVITIPSTSLKK